MVKLSDEQKRYIKEELKPYLEDDDLVGVLNMLVNHTSTQQDYDISSGYYRSSDAPIVFYAPICAFLCEVGVPLLENLDVVPISFCCHVDGLESLHTPSNISCIEDWAFCGCSDLKTVTFEEGLKTIKYNAFSRTNLSSVVLPKSLERVCPGAFAEISHIEVHVQSDVSFSPACFAHSNVDLYVPADILGNDSSNINHFLSKPRKGKVSLNIV